MYVDTTMPVGTLTRNVTDMCSVWQIKARPPGPEYSVYYHELQEVSSNSESRAWNGILFWQENKQKAVHKLTSCCLLDEIELVIKHFFFTVRMRIHDMATMSDRFHSVII